MRGNILLLLLASIFLVSCNMEDCIKGSGKIVASNFDVRDYSGIYLEDEFDVVVEQNDTNYFEVYVEADQEFMPYIDVVKSNDDLIFRIKSDKCFNGERPRIYVYTPDLYYVNNSGPGSVTCYDVYNDKLLSENEGSGNIYFENLDTYDVEVHNSGSGKIQLRGNALYGNYLNSGSGLIYARDLVHQEADVEISGSGDVYVFVVNKLNAKISGSGDLFYRGSPDIYTNITGTGDVFDANN